MESQPLSQPPASAAHLTKQESKQTSRQDHVVSRMAAGKLNNDSANNEMNRAISDDEGVQSESDDINLDYCDDIKLKILLLFGTEVEVSPAHFSSRDGVYLNTIEVRKLAFNKVDKSFMNDFVQFAQSLIDRSESPAKANKLIERCLNFPVSNITVFISLDGIHCRIRIGAYLIVSNSDCMSPAYFQTLCRVDSEVIEEILKKNDPASGAQQIPVLRGCRDMGLNTARYLGLT